MIHRAIVAFFGAAALVTAGTAPAALADTGGPPQPADIVTIGTHFSFTDRRGAEFSGIAQIEEDRLAGTKSVSFFFAGDGDSETCDAGTPEDPSDDYVGTEYIEFFATRSSILVYRVRADLTGAVAAFAVAGQRVRTDACTGEIESRRAERHLFEFRLQATAPPSVEESTSVVDNGDGTCSAVTETVSITTASASASLDARSVSTADASIQRYQATVEPAPCG
jgi:hypothetical protein